MDAGVFQEDPLRQKFNLIDVNRVLADLHISGLNRASLEYIDKKVAEQLAAGVQPVPQSKAKAVAKSRAQAMRDRHRLAEAPAADDGAVDYRVLYQDLRKQHQRLKKKHTRTQSKLIQVRTSNRNTRRRVRRAKKSNIKLKSKYKESARNLVTAQHYYEANPHRKRRKKTSRSRVSVPGGYKIGIKRNKGHAGSEAVLSHLEASFKKHTPPKWERLLAANLLLQARDWYHRLKPPHRPSKGLCSLVKPIRALYILT